MDNKNLILLSGSNCSEYYSDSISLWNSLLNNLSNALFRIYQTVEQTAQEIDPIQSLIDILDKMVLTMEQEHWGQFSSRSSLLRSVVMLFTRLQNDIIRSITFNDVEKNLIINTELTNHDSDSEDVLQDDRLPWHNAPLLEGMNQVNCNAQVPTDTIDAQLFSFVLSVQSYLIEMCRMASTQKFDE